MISIRIELRNQATGALLDVFEKHVTERDNIGMFLDGVRTMVNTRITELAEAPPGPCDDCSTHDFSCTGKCKQKEGGAESPAPS